MDSKGFKLIALVLALLILFSGCSRAAAPTEATVETTAATQPPRVIPPEEQEAIRVAEVVKKQQTGNSFTFLAFADAEAIADRLADQASAMIQAQVDLDFTASLDATADEEYTFRDLEKSKTRVIMLNTSSDAGLTVEQLQWFIQSLDLSQKADARDWGILILSHMPLDFGWLLDSAGRILDAYLCGISGTIPYEDTTIEFDFAGRNSAGIIGNIHGYTRCLLADNLYLTNAEGAMYRSGVVRICIPNMASEGTNQFGTNAGTDSNGIEFGEAETYEKVADTEKAIAFNVVTVEREKKVIYCVNYGAGYDREIPYAKGLLSETPVSGTPAPAGEYTNLVPTSTEFGRRNTNIFNETGYRNHTYLVCNDISEEPWPYGHDAEYVTTGAIPFTVPSYLTPPTIYIWGVTLDESDHTRFFIYDSQKYRLVLQATGAEFKNYFTIEQLGEQYYKLTPIPEGKASVLFPATNGRAGKGSIAFSLKGTGENLVITVGEPILPE